MGGRPCALEQVSRNLVLDIDWLSLRPSLDYQARYCEENVWRLLARSELAGRQAWAVIVSSPSGYVVELRQRAGRPGDGLVCWDYHVFALVDDVDGTRLVLDLDSDLPFPCPLARYLAESFPPMRLARHDPSIRPDTRPIFRPISRPISQPIFRVIAAADYLSGLATDRSHMREPDGSYLAPPPPWPAPGVGKNNTLRAWIDVGCDGPGVLCGLEQLGTIAT
jgi:hypothetical protein